MAGGIFGAPPKLNVPKLQAAELRARMEYRVRLSGIGSASVPAAPISVSRVNPFCRPQGARASNLSVWRRLWPPVEYFGTEAAGSTS